MGRNNADFQGVTVTHEPMGIDMMVRAHHPEHGQIGWMRLHSLDPAKNGREVRMVRVNDEFQRKGVAKAMWDYAKNAGLQPLHSTITTKEGSAWAKAVGD